MKDAGHVIETGQTELSSFAEVEYREFFERVTGKAPYDYQIRTAKELSRDKNLILRIPTGAGKTWAVIVPFLYRRNSGGPARLIYALPLRTLANGVYQVAKKAAATLGLPIEPAYKDDTEMASPFVTLQTGEQPDDPFFTRGTIIVTTYDQLLSGLLGGPYGLPSKLRNINCSAIMGTVVVFDEFHLMEPQRAFLTAVAGHKLFKDFTQSVWMTATATSPLVDVLCRTLDCQPISLSAAEKEHLPSIARVERRLVPESHILSVQDILRTPEGRSIVLLNTVGRAQEVFKELADDLRVRRPKIPAMLLHSRFFKNDRKDKEERLRELFGPEAKGPAILVATQVIEAGLDISCDHMHTELCPMNSLVQRAGRCARFEGESGIVHVYLLPETERAWLPYGTLSRQDPTMEKTREFLARIPATTTFTPDIATDWVEQVHAEEDGSAMCMTPQTRLQECLTRVERNAIKNDSIRVADLIRGDDTERIRVILAREGSLPASPGEREGISLSRWSLTRLLTPDDQDPGWFWDFTQEPVEWKPLQNKETLKIAYAVCLSPEFAAYDKDLGLRLGEAGFEESPPRMRPPRPGYAPLQAESWLDHAVNVSKECRRRFESECESNSLLAKGLKARFGLERQQALDIAVAAGAGHDLGKLNADWQRWAEEVQRLIDERKLGLLPLAHTDFDANDARHRDSEVLVRKQGVHRPVHAAQSAYLLALCDPFQGQLPLQLRAEAISACVAAIIAHHGGWLPTNIQLDNLTVGWSSNLEKVLGQHVNESALTKFLTIKGKNKSREVEKLLRLTIHPNKLAQWWPLVAYITRTLRLSDQRATAEGGSE